MNFNFKKKYGQNFLIDNNIINRIVDNMSDYNDSLVIEIGCGDGRLTKKLCEKFTFVLGYEIDEEVKELLFDNLSQYSNKKIIFGDFLTKNVLDDLNIKKYENIYVIANLPYYITTPIIEKLINQNINIKEMRLMMQKEVGDRFSAKINTKNYSSITVFLNYYFDIKKLFLVSRNCYIPRPNVDSVVLSFKSKKDKIYLKNDVLFFKLVRDAFKYKRKTIKNNLKEYDLEKINRVLIENNLDLTSRAEQIPLEIFCKIANELD